MEYRYKRVRDKVLRDRVMENGKEIEYRDVEVDSSGGRPRLKEMINRLESGDIVRVREIREIARDIDDFMMIYSKIVSKGCVLKIDGYEDIVLAMYEYSKIKNGKGRPKKVIDDKFEEWYGKWVTKQIRVTDFMEEFGYNTRDALYKQIRKYEADNGIDRESMR